MNSQFRDIQQQIDTIVKNGELPVHLYKSANGISKILSAIQETHGINWASHVTDESGNPLLTPEEQQKFTDAFQPYIPAILIFLGNRTTGGEIEVPSYDIPDVKSLTKMDTPQLADGSSKEDPEQMYGIDNLYAKVIQRIGLINSSVNDYMSKHGILHMEKKSDMEPDVRLIPEPLAQLISKGITAISGIPPQSTMEAMNKIKVPFRLIVMVVYLCLDVARISASVTGSDSNRKIISIMVALIDLLKGDWKKAVLSFMGFYGTTPLLMGQMMKIYLTMFQTISPTLQDSILYGTLDLTKSFFIGVLLAIFKVTAPEEVRLPIIGILEKIALKKAEIDGMLIEKGLSARSDAFAPSYEDFNNLQALMDDPEFICSTEFEDLIQQVNTSSIINLILQILRIPVTKEFRAYRCGNKPSKPFLTLIVDKAKKDKEVQDVLERPFSGEDLQMPVSVSTEPASEKTENVSAEEAAVTEEPLAEETPLEEEPVVEETPAVEEKPVEESEEAPAAEIAAASAIEEPTKESEEPSVEPEVESPLPPTIPTSEPSPPVESPPLPPTIKGGRTQRNRRHSRRKTRKPRRH